jgi:membrane-associated protein
MELLDYILHVDEYLGIVINLFGNWSYVILFAVIFAETGLVVIPFLPGDSLLFAVGALAGGGYLHIGAAYLTMLAAAILGDTVNYWVGHLISARVFAQDNSKIFNKAYLEKTREFYERYGGKTIILARFLPIVRTFAPFVAGIGKMRYSTFFLYNIIGAVLWVTSMTFAGYFFGGLPFVKEHFEFVVIGIVLLSILPMVAEYIRHKRGPAVSPEQLRHATYTDVRDTFRKEHLDDTAS